MNKLKKVLEDSLAETNIAISTTPNREVIDIANKIDSILNGSDPLKILNVRNYDVFYLLFHEMNIEDYSEEEIKQVCEEVRHTVNTWTFTKTSKELETLYNHTNMDKSFSDSSCLQAFHKLGLPAILLEYDLKMVYLVMNQFLELKANLEENVKYYDEQAAASRNLIYTNPRSAMMKDKKVFIKEIIEDLRFGQSLKIIRENLLGKEKEYKTNLPVLQERKKATKDVLSKIADRTLETTTEMTTTWHHYLDPKALRELYRVLNNNQVTFKKGLDEREHNLTQILEFNPLIKYCFDNGINPKSVECSLDGIPNVVEKIEFLKTLNVPLEAILTIYKSYLFLLDEDLINTLNNLIRLNALSSKTILSNLELIAESKKKVIANFEILKNIIDFNNQFYDDHIMLLDLKELQNRLSVLKEYKLSLNNYMFLLCNYEYLSIYDLVLESNIPDYLLITICKTSNPINTIKRIKIYQSIEEPFETPSHSLRKELTGESRFIIPDTELDTYIPNIVPSLVIDQIKGSKITNIPNNISQLEKYRRFNVYNINGVRISRPKFLRNFECKKHNPDFLISSLVSNSILDESAYYLLITEIEEKHIKQK